MANVVDLKCHDTTRSMQKWNGFIGMKNDDQILLTWTAHPARDRVWRAALGGVVIAFAVFTIYGFSISTGATPQEAVIWAVLTLIVLFLSLNRFFLPSRFVIDQTGITARYPMRRVRFQWQDIRRWCVDSWGGFLSTRSRSSILDSFHGMHLWFDQSKREVIIADIERLLVDAKVVCSDAPNTSNSQQSANSDATDSADPTTMDMSKKDPKVARIDENCTKSGKSEGAV